jgi:hypothetical protein
MMSTALTSAVAAVLVLTACSAPAALPTPVPETASASESPAGTGPAKSPPPVLTAQQLCTSALTGRSVLGWGTTTVGDLRAYRYGPQGNPPPLLKAFPGTPDDAPATWCATKAAGRATAWWGVWSDEAHRVITINGPGEGHRLGEVSGPPPVP